MPRGNATCRSTFGRARLGRHVGFGLAGAALTGAVYLMLGSDYVPYGLSMATAYASVPFFALTLLIGPWNVLRRRPNPVSTYLRRDLGIWAGTLGLAHVVFGLQVHFPGRMWAYFVPQPELGSRLPIRLDLFGGANYTGLAATLILIALLALSNNVSLRALGSRRWKALQRWNYAGAALVLTHGALYQIVEKRALGYVLAFAAAVALVAAGQALGYRRRASDQDPAGAAPRRRVRNR